jgi:predicted nucleotide-binding protein
VAEKLLGTVHSLSQELQNQSFDYLSAQELLDTTKNDLHKLQNVDTWDLIVKEADAIDAQIGIPHNDNYSARPQRAQAMSKKLSECFVLSTTCKTVAETIQSNEDCMRIRVLYACVDKLNFGT